MRIGSNFYMPHNLEWASEQKAKNIHAGTETRIVRGVLFEKTLALTCPWCHDVFFVWQASNNPGQPFVDPSPISAPGMGQRYTCGHPICWHKEQEYQVRQTDAYRNACSDYFLSKEPKSKGDLKPKAKLVKLVD